MLNVAGAYHSRLMESAYRKLGEVLLQVEMQIPQFPVISNVTGEEVDTLPEIRTHITGTGDSDGSLVRLHASGCWRVVASFLSSWDRAMCWQVCFCAHKKV